MNGKAFLFSEYLETVKRFFFFLNRNADVRADLPGALGNSLLFSTLVREPVSMDVSRSGISSVRTAGGSAAEA